MITFNKSTGISVHIAVLSLMLAVFTFSYSIYDQQNNKLLMTQRYLKLLEKEINLNLHFVKSFEKTLNDNEGLISLPIVPVMSAYEAGLKDGYIIVLPSSTQNSLFTAYVYAQNIIRYSQDYSLSQPDIRRGGMIRVYTDAFKVNLEDAKQRGIYSTITPAGSMYVTQAVSFIAPISMAIYFMWLISFSRRHKGRRR